MRIAIHHKEGTFSDRWIAYCKEKGIYYKIVNAYDTDIISKLSDCDAFMWHFHQGDYRDMQFAKALILSLEANGVHCFPNSKTCWHFDNKVWEKYLLESVGAPLVPSYVFYTEKEALAWTKQTTFPKVFKLKGGASANNVMLAHTEAEARKLIKQAFGSGFRQYRWQEHLKEAWRKYRMGKATMREVLRPMKYALRRYPTSFDHYHGREMGYAYFQDFIPNNTYDIRVVVIGDKLMAEKRYTREGDFRASGSGHFEYSSIPEEVMKIAFVTAEKLKLQSVAFDFIYDNGKPLIIEMSYGFGTHGIAHSGGYWTRDFQRHEANPIDFCGWMVENLLRS